MITIPELASEALGTHLATHMGRRYGSTDAELVEIVESAARPAIDCTGNETNVTSAIRIIASNDPSPWSGENPNHLSIKSTGDGTIIPVASIAQPVVSFSTSSV